MKRGWRILLVLLVVIGISVLVSGWYHFRAKRAVAAYRVELKAKGEKLSVAELIPPVVESSQNARVEFFAALTKFSSRFPPLGPPFREMLAPAHALVSWKQELAPTDNATNVWPTLAAQVRANRAALAALHASLARPVLAFDINYFQMAPLAKPHLEYVMFARDWLPMAALSDLHEGRYSNAWDNVHACVRLARIYRGEAVESSLLIRGSLAEYAAGITWQALQYPGWTDEQLADLQHEWEGMDLANQLEPVLAMQRALLPGIFDAGRSAYTSVQSLTLRLQGLLPDASLNDEESFVQRYPSYWQWKWWGSYEEELASLRAFQLQLEAARSVVKGEASIPALKRASPDYPERDRLDPDSEARFRGVLRAIVAGTPLPRVAYIEIERRLTITAVALQRYRLKFGKYPAELRELTPDYLSQVTLDFMDGKPLLYRPKPDGGFVLYSVGENGMDDGGDGALRPGYEGGHLHWFFRKTKDAVWPEAATAEEAKAYQEKALRLVIPLPSSRTSSAGTNSAGN